MRGGTIFWGIRTTNSHREQSNYWVPIKTDTVITVLLDVKSKMLHRGTQLLCPLHHSTRYSKMGQWWEGKGKQV